MKNSQLKVTIETNLENGNQAKIVQVWEMPSDPSKIQTDDEMIEKLKNIVGDAVKPILQSLRKDKAR